MRSAPGAFRRDRRSLWAGPDRYAATTVVIACRSVVGLTDAGLASLQHIRALSHTALLGHLETLPDDQLSALAAATDALTHLIAVLLNDPLEREAGQ